MQILYQFAARLSIVSFVQFALLFGIHFVILHIFGQAAYGSCETRVAYALLHICKNYAHILPRQDSLSSASSPMTSKPSSAWLSMYSFSSSAVISPSSPSSSSILLDISRATSSGTS